MQLDSIRNFDFRYLGSNPNISTNGVFRLTVKSFACEAKNVSSILTLHPIIQNRLTDKPFGYDPKNRSSNLLSETKADMM